MKLPSWFLNMSIGSRLGWGFALLVGLTLAYGGLTLSQMRDLADQTNLLFQHPFTVTRAVDAVELNVLKIHREMKDLAHAQETEDIEKNLDRVDAYEQEAFRQLEIARQRFLGDPLEVKRVHDALDTWRPIRQEVATLRLKGAELAADAITRGKGARHVALLEQELEELKDFAEGKAAEAIARSGEILKEALTAALLLLLGATGVGTAVALATTYSIRTPLTHLDRAATGMTEGDLDQEVPIHSEDELGRLSRNFNGMANSIREQTREIERKNEENEGLLLNILPGPIAERLKHGEETIADHFPEVTVLFSDIVGFTPLSAELPPAELVEILDEIFSAFDDSARTLGIEKIKTIGDAYMAVAGLTVALEDPVSRMVEMALAMLRAVDRINERRGTSFSSADRHQLRSGRRGCHRKVEVHLRSVGRCGKHREPHGIPRHQRAHSDHGAGKDADRRPLPGRRTWRGPSEGTRNGQDIFDRRSTIRPERRPAGSGVSNLYSLGRARERRRASRCVTTTPLLENQSRTSALASGSLRARVTDTPGPRPLASVVSIK